MAKKKKTLSFYKHKLDKVFSEYTRRRYANDNGLVQCFTCRCVKHWKDMQNSHFVPRNISSTRYDETNCHPACKGCNIFKSGALDVYAVELEAKYGKGILQKLAEKKRTTKRFTIPELEEMIDYYTDKLKELQ